MKLSTNENEHFSKKAKDEIRERNPDRREQRMRF